MRAEDIAAPPPARSRTDGGRKGGRRLVRQRQSLDGPDWNGQPNDAVEIRMSEQKLNSSSDLLIRSPYTTTTTLIADSNHPAQFHHHYFHVHHLRHPMARNHSPSFPCLSCSTTDPTTAAATAGPFAQRFLPETAYKSYPYLGPRGLVHWGRGTDEDSSSLSPYWKKS